MSSDFSVVVLGGYGPSLINFRGPMIAAMIKRGWRVTAVAPEIDETVAAALRALGADVVSIDMARTGMNPLADLAYRAELRALFSRLKPDVLLAYTAKPVIWGALAARAAGVPRVVVMITGLGFAFTDGAGSALKRGVARIAASFLYRRALKRADRVLFQNPDDRDLFLAKGLLEDGERVGMTDGSGIDLDLFTPGPPPAAPIFLMVARLLGAKGVREYAAAARDLKRRWPEARFQLAGYIDPGPDSVDESELAAWIGEGLEFLGRLDDVRPAITAASVFVLPSWREGTPRSVLEAMAMGRAVVTTDAPGCRETVAEGENGFLVPPRNAGALAAAMERFILDPTLASRMGPASRALACRRYDVHRVNEQIMSAVDPDG